MHTNQIPVDETRLLTYTDPFPGQADTDTVFVPCGRCGGMGYLPGYEFSDNARCWGCMGAKGKNSTVKAERAKEKARITRANNEERKLIAKQVFHNQQMAKAEAEYPILAGWHDAMHENAFLSDLWSKAFDYELSEKQVAAAARVLQANADWEAARAAEQAQLTPVIEGKQTVVGEILTVKYQENNFGGSWKMLVKDDRKFKVWGTLPTSVINALDDEAGYENNPALETLVGRRVQFNATLSVSDDDKTFGFYSRPTKAALLPR